MKHIAHVVGARPQFVKLAPLYHVLKDTYQQTIIHTGQHYDAEMSEFFFRDLMIPAPLYNLNIGSGSQGAQTGNMLIELEKVFTAIKPDMLIIYGDTNSTLAGALAAAKLGLPTVHVEAGLRSFNRTMPEEINRIVADHTSDYLFCPTAAAMHNLTTEGCQEKAYLTGDIMVDSLKSIRHFAAEQSRIFDHIAAIPGSYNLLTLHRPYNVDDIIKLRHILASLNELRETIVFPVHPRTREMINRDKDSFFSLKNIRYVNPLGYLDFVNMEANSLRIITDSGGIQKEAYILRKPCITLRTETEWIETVQEGWNLLLSPEEPHFQRAIIHFMPPMQQNDVFGTNVAQRMLETISTLSF